MTKKILQITFSLLFSLFAFNKLHAQISGIVYRDFNANGVRTATLPIEPLLKGIIVTAYNSTGAQVGIDTTDALGAYSFTGLTLPLRIEFTGEESSYFTGPNGAGNASSVQFYSAASTTANYGVNYPADYCQSTNPNMLTMQYTNGNPLGGGTAGTRRGLITFDYNSAGDATGDPDLAPLAYTADPVTFSNPTSTTGPVWGIAYQRTNKRAFAAAFVKRHQGIGPLGEGGIYSISYTGGAPVVSNFVDVNTIGINTGVVGTGATPALRNTSRGLSNVTTTPNPSGDPLAFDAVGKVGLGDIDISDDESTLYVINLFDQKLYGILIDADNNPITPPVAADVTAYSLPANPCTGGVLRPFAVKYYKGNVYVGAVCDASLQAFVYKLVGTSFVPVLVDGASSIPLTYTKGQVTSSPGCNVASNNGWFTWSSTPPTACDAPGSANELFAHPSPILCDIEFDVDGSMIVSFIDRAGHQYGAGNTQYDGAGLETVHSGGDILRICNVGGNFVMQGASGCSNNAANNQGPNGGEFYNQDFLNFAAGGGLLHSETTVGGMALLPGRNEVAVTCFDPFGGPFLAGGVNWFNNTTGASRAQGYFVYFGTTNASYPSGDFSKAAGMGDIELLCDAAPIEIGNRVWLDSDNDGIQDANESGLASLTVQLFKAGVQVGTTTTSSTGHYYFNNANVTMNGATGITPNTAYEIRLSTGTYLVTALNTDGSPNGDARDNDASGTGTAVIAFTTGGPGENNHTYDFGLLCSGVISVTTNYTAATCPAIGIVANNNASLQITSNGDKVALSTTGTPTTLYSAASALVAGTFTFTALNGTADSFYVRVWNGAICYRDTIIVVTPKKCCPTINAITTPANNALYCSGAVIPTFNVSTNAIAPDSIRLVYLTTLETDPSLIYNGAPLAQKAITGVAASNNTANFTNVQLPTTNSSTDDTIWIYAIYIDHTGDTTCKIYAVKPMILKHIPLANIDAIDFLCNGTAATLTSDVATTYKWGLLGSATALATTQTFTVTPPINSSTTYYLITSVNSCSSDTAFQTIVTTTGVLGTVFRDFNSNGIKETTEKYGVSNVHVRAINDAGVIVDSAITDIDGRYVMSNVTAAMGKVRIEFVKSTLPVGYQESYSGTNNGTDVQFVTVPACAVNWGVKFVGDYCQSNPLVVVTSFINGASGNATAPTGALNKFSYLTTGATINPGIAANKADVGSVWGLAYNKKNNDLYSSTFLKRHAGLKDVNSDGAGDLGVIWKTTDPNALTSTSSVWANLSAAPYNLDLGTIGSDASRGLAAPTAPSNDPTTFSLVAKVGLGDIDISDDFSALWAVNVKGNQLLKIGIDASGAPGTMQTYNIPNACSGSYDTLFIKAGGTLSGSLVNGYIGDEYYVGGTTANSGQTGTAFSTFRYGANFDYRISVPNGTYNVLLTVGTNSSVLNQTNTVEGVAQTFTQIANTTGTQLFSNVTVTDDRLDINFADLPGGGANGVNAIISGIKIWSTSATPFVNRSYPFALKYKNGKVYVGTTCGAELTQDKNQLFSTVYEFDGSGFTPMLTVPLQYTHGAPIAGGVTRWQAWTGAFGKCSQYAPSGWTGFYPQPVLSDIEFAENGDLIVGFFDRWGHQSGDYNYATAGSGAIRTTVAGDVLRARFDNGVYTLESNGSVGALKSTGGVGNNEGPGGGEFYVGENYANAHEETSYGGLALIPGKNELALTVLDPLAVVTGGVLYLNNTTGVTARSYEVTNTSINTPTNFTKANALGDIEILCSEAPLQIGNFVWLDSDADGIQDPSESAMPNITVSLWKAGTQIASTTTNTNGEYYFSTKAPLGALWTGTGADTTLLPNTAYEVRINMATYPNNQITLSNSTLSSANDQNDNDATLVSSYATIPFTTGEKGSINHTYDFGFTCTAPVVGYTYTQALNCTGITPSNNATLQITSVGSDKVAMSTTGTPTTLYSAATALVAGSFTYTAQNGLTDSFYVRVWNGATCFKDTLIVVKPKKCCPTMNAITVPASNATYCAGSSIPAFNVATNAINPDSIRLVYFTSAQTDPYTINNGPILDQKIITGTAATNTVSFTNVQLPSPFTGATDTIWIYAIYIDHTDDTSCKIFQSKPVILEPQQTQVIYGYDQVCSGASVTLTTNGAVTYQWGSVTPPSSSLGTTQSITVTPTAPTTYWVKGTNTIYGCSSDTAFFTVSPGAGIYGTVYYDFNANGMQDANETGGISNITVRAFDSTGALIGVSTTNVLGRYNISNATPAMGKLRVEFDKTTFPAGFNSSFVGTSNGTDVQFVTATECNASLGLFQAGQYCENSPNMALVRFQRNNVTGTTNMVAMMGYNTSAIPFAPVSGVDNTFNWGLPNNNSPLVTNYPIPAQTTVATYANVGTTFGLGWDRKNKQLFTGAYMRAFSDMGTNASANTFGEGIIYSIPIDGGTVGTSNVWLDLETFLGDDVAGTFVADAAHPGPAVYGRSGANPNKIGFTGLGEIKVSDDGTQLYVVNLAVPEVLVIPIGPGGTAPTLASAIKRFPFPSTDIPVGSWSYGKPYMAALGLGVHPITGKVFATLTATGPTVNDLKGIVYSLDPSDATPSSADFVKEIEIPMNFSRPATNVNVSQVYAMINKPWESIPANNSFYANVQTTHPWLGEIVFDLQPDGKYAMTIAERNRFHDQVNGSFFVTGGVMYKVSTDGSNWILENNGAASPLSTSVNWTNSTANSAGTHTGANNRFYRSFGVEGSFSGGTLGHIPGSKEVIAPAMDNVYFNGGSGIAWLNTINGNRTKNSRLLSDGTVAGYNANPFTKANNFGDIEPLCGEAPLQIGNYVWVDADHDGVQDPNETPLNNITVTLCKGGNPIATTTTNTKGEYYFSENSAAGVTWTGTGADTTLLPNTTYELKILMSQSGIATPNYYLTQSNSASGNDQNDNDATVVSGNAVIQLTTGVAGSINHTYDFGFSDLAPAVFGSLGNYVWNDLNGNGLLDEPSSSGINGLKVYLLNSSNAIIDSTTTVNNNGNPGYYLFDSLSSGTYKVQFPITISGNNLTTTTTTVAVDSNSDADIITGLSPAVVINASGVGVAKDNPTIDAAYHACGSAGNYVWNDLNGNGTNDELATTGINGVAVELWKETSPGSGTYALLSSTVTANDQTGNPGYYNLKICDSANYKIKFPLTNGGNNLTTQITTPGTDNNNDANPTDGFSPVFSISPNGSGVAKDNPTIDAAYHACGSAGNYVWNDLNGNGTNDELATTGINGVAVELWKETSPGSGTYALISSTVTANDQTSNPGYYNFKICDSANYKIKFPLTNGGNNLSTQTTTPGTDNNNDANPTDGFSPVFSISPNGSGVAKDNPTIDAAYAPPTPYGSLGNYLWIDSNGNGLQDEAATSGLNGLTLCLLNSANVVIDSTVTANNGIGNPGYYLFDSLASGTYSIKFPTTNSGNGLTIPVTTPATDGNSDANATTGLSPQVVINASGSGTDKDNMTIDAGYFKPACLGNYVWNDIDKDGVQDNTEVGVAGITVTLYDQTNAVLSSTITDAYGYYKFNPLNPDTYKVGFTLPANYVFTGANTPGNDSLDSDVNPNTGKTNDYILVSGDSNMTVDAGIYFQQPLTASVGNFVWLDGNADGIQDPGETGISGITVTLCNSAGTPVATTITNAQGYYLFTDVTPGNYSVGFTPKAGLEFSPNNNIVSSPSNSDANPSTGKTNLFNVNAGDAITFVDAGLYLLASNSPNVGGLGDRVWYDIDQDGIQDTGEPGVQGVSVSLYSGNGTTLLKTTTTDAYGNYIFNNLSQGQYVVGFTNLPLNYVLTTNSGLDSTTNSDAIIATAKTPIIQLAQAQFNLTYDAGIHTTLTANTNSIGDKVWDDFDKDGIQDAGEPGVPGITVTLYNASGNPIDVVSTDLNGNYLFPDLPNGTYSVGFDNLPVGYIFSPTGQGNPSNDNDADPTTGLTPQVVLTGNTHITDLDAGINMGNPEIGLGSLGDLVWYDLDNDGLQDPGEAGVQGVTAVLYESNGTTQLSTTTTDALGNYIFTGLAAGDYIVGFTNLPVGFTISPNNADGQGINGEVNSDVNPLNNKTDLTSLGTGEDKLSVDMGIVPPIGTASLGDLVWFDLNNDGLQTIGEPGVQGVAVTLYNASGNTVGTTVTDANGEYHFVGLNPGSYKVGFNNYPAGYTSAIYNSDASGLSGALNSDADPANGNMTTLVSLLAGDNKLFLDAGIVSTTVASVGDFVWHDINQNGIQDINEPPIGGVLVTLHNQTSGPVTSAISKPDGSYIFTNVIPDNYAVEFSNIPSNMVFTLQESVPTSNTGSNVVPTTGFTPGFTVAAGTHNPTIDAGLTTPILSGLGNFVWNDINVDGLQTLGEPGVAGVVATLYANDGTTILGTTITDGNGAYSFTDLNPDAYLVGFSNLPQGYIPTTASGTLNDPSNSDMNVNTLKTSLVSLAAGEYNPNVDGGIRLNTLFPVDLDKFIVTESNCEVVLSWSTITEKNVSHFDIMRKEAKEANYQKIGKVMAVGNTSVSQQYSYNEASLENGNYTYYLQIVDIDGKLYNSSVASVDLNCQTNLISVFPNPTSDLINVKITSSELSDYQIRITDLSGKVLMHTSTTVNNGQKIVVLPIANFAAGNYHVLVSNEFESHTFKILKAR